MTTDVFDLASHEVEHEGSLSGPAATGVPPEPRSPLAPAAAPVPDDRVPLGELDPDKLPFLSWLWQHHVPGDEFYPLAHLVLSGGPGDVWARKTVLVPSFVARDIAEFFAVGRIGVTEAHLDLANKAVLAYRASAERVSELVSKRRKSNGGREPANHEIKDAQVAGFLDLGTMPVGSRANNASAAINEIVPEVSADDVEPPADFRYRLFKVRCTYQGQERSREGPNHKICGRPSVAGSMLCVEHGGVPLAYTADELREIYDGARQRLLAATLMAVDATIDLATNSTNDMVRLKAAEVILDRTGFVPGVEIHLPGQVRGADGDKTPAQIILERLEQLGVSVPHANGAAKTHSEISDEDIVEAEVVSDPVST